MTFVRSASLVVHLSVRDDAGAVVRRVRLRVSAGRPAGVVLDRVLRRVLAERGRGRSVAVDAPYAVVVLLAECGLDGLTRWGRGLRR